jgi:hypothetical protein
MADFDGPTGMTFNRGLIADPTEYARDAGAASWLYMCSDEFASTPGGMSYADVQQAVPDSVHVIADTPPLTTELAQELIAALDELPRPTLVTCRIGPRSSALVYMYAGLKAGASADEVIARAEVDEAPFVQMDPLKAWVAQGLSELREA